MKILQFFKTTAIGGLVFLLPFAFVLLLVGYVVNRLLPLFEAVAARLQLPLIEGAVLAFILLTGFLVLLCFLAGLIARALPGAWVRDWIETKVLGRVPMYRMLQSVGEEIGGDSSTAMHAALVWTDGWQLAFVVERHADGGATVVLPDAPAANSGTVLHLPIERVHLLDAKVADVLMVQRHMGLGSAELLQGKVPPPPAGN
jgi:uncharacterized membrane protein